MRTPSRNQSVLYVQNTNGKNPKKTTAIKKERPKKKRKDRAAKERTKTYPA